MKRKILTLLAVVFTVATLMCVTALAVSADAEPSATIAKFNLAFEDNTYLKYAVRFDGVADEKITENNIGMLYWTDYEGGFVPGTEDYSSVTTGYTTIGGVKHYVFEYTRLAAKQLTDYIYSVAYLELGGETYYSEPVKYSALEYAYNRLGKTSEGTTNEELKTLLNNMLAYGASAQQYFDYKEDRLATADFYQITIVGGTLDDGFASGLYLSTDEVTITAPETDGDMVFDHWTNNLDETVSTDNPMIVSNLIENVIHTANYKVDAKYSDGLEFASNGDGTCCVSGIGTCTDTDIVIPEVSPDGDKVTSIGDRAFWGCDLLKTVEIPKGVTSIEEWAFYSCDSLKSIALPDSLTSIGYAAFYSCFSLARINLPNGLTNIGECAFVVCSALTSIEIPASVTNIDNAAFRGCTSVTSFYVDENNSNYKSLNGNLYTKGGDTLLAYAAGKTESSFVIPDHVTNIGDSAFWGSSSLESIVIPDNVISIGNNAFRQCTALPSIDIPDTVTSIGESAFEYCTSLTSIVIPNSITNMGKWAFSECSALESVEILDGLTSISYAAFGNCTALKSISLPISIVNIGDYAFEGCTILTNIYYSGSEADFANITIASANESFDAATIYYNYDPTAK